jgi:DNA (cytosine-5)-methyltransferase 1
VVATKKHQRRLRSIELFTGAGGLAIGTHLAGCDHAALLEWDQSACDTLRTNLKGNHVNLGDCEIMQTDVRDIRFSMFGEVDLVAGGPPCQPFSLGGKGVGMDDGRNMIPEFTRAVSELTPRAFIMENVKGLLRPRFETYFSYALLCLTYPTVKRKKTEAWFEHLSRLEKIHTEGKFSDVHYNVVFRLLNSADYGVPQTRERVFVVGFRADTGIKWNFPDPTHSYEALHNSQFFTGEYWKKHGLQRPEKLKNAVKPKQYNFEDMLLLNKLPWTTIRDALRDLPTPRAGKKFGNILNHDFMSGARTYAGHTGSPYDLPSKTLKAGDHGVPGGENMIVYPDDSKRYFTVREAARIQTFPDTWQLEGAWSRAMKQLGNAVPVQLARVVAESVTTGLTK